MEYLKNADTHSVSNVAAELTKPSGRSSSDESGDEKGIEDVDEVDANGETGEPGIMLSAETLLALQEFAVDSGVAVDASSVIKSVRQHFELQQHEREERFDVQYSSKDGQRCVKFQLNGLRKELGQTLDSTGLTIWRAAEHMCQFIIDHPSYFTDKSICELGAGLGLVAVMLDKLAYSNKLTITDGDEDTMKLLIDNKIDNECTFDTSYLLWGENEDFLSANPDKFDLLIAADVIYEEQQVVPLLDTVVQLMKPITGQFLLAFARRNVNIDLVHHAAKERNLEWRIVDDSPDGVVGVEPIYLFTWQQPNLANGL